MVINDGSKDSSSAIGHEYESKFPQTFRVIDKGNGNYGSCINRGLKEATGKYVKVLDADDYYVNDVFDSFISFLTRTDVDLVINDYQIVDENDEVKETFPFDLPQNGNFTLKEIPREMIAWLWHQSVTYKKSVPLSINYRQTEGISYTDDEWVFEPVAAVRTVAYFPKIMYNYFLGREGQTFDPKIMKSSFDKRILVGKSMAKFYARVCNTLPSDVKYFMDEKIRARISAIYRFYLMKQYSKEGNELLKDFDLYLKEISPQVWQFISNKKNRFGGKFYITEWRDAGYKLTLLQRYRLMKFKWHLWRGGEFRSMNLPDHLRRV